MASVAPQLLDGITCSFSAATTVLGLIKSFSHDGMSREFVDASHAGSTGAKPMLPARTYNPGRITIGMLFDSDANVTDLNTALGATTAGTLTVTLGDGETITYSCYLAEFSWSGEHEGIIESTAVFQATAAPTW